MSKNTICLWYDKDAKTAARFYAATFPDSAVGAVHHAPSDYPGGKEGDVLTVEFTVLGIPCLGLNGGPVLPKIRKRRTTTGTQSSVMADRRASAGGAKISGEFPGRSRRAS
jgi:predicted 3-demethylubiquinone-9 3-methyltransferase (glyoxalase superfamily)